MSLNSIQRYCKTTTLLDKTRKAGFELATEIFVMSKNKLLDENTNVSRKQVMTTKFFWYNVS